MKEINENEFEKIQVGDFKYRARRGDKRSEDTINQYLHALKKFDEFLVKNNRNPTPQALDDFITELEKKEVSSKSQAKYYWAIEFFFRRSKNYDFTKDEIKEAAEPPKSKVGGLKEGIDYPSPADCRRLVNEMPDDNGYDKRDRALISTIFSTGARRGEIAELDIDDYNPPKLRIEREKTEEESMQVRKLDDRTVNFLEEYIDIRNDDCPALFITYGKLSQEDEARRISSGAIYRIVKKWTKTILGESYSPHKLRHSRASQLAREGLSMKVVGEFLGISTQTADQVYSHLSPAEMEDVPDAF